MVLVLMLVLGRSSITIINVVDFHSVRIHIHVLQFVCKRARTCSVMMLSSVTRMTATMSKNFVRLLLLHLLVVGGSGGGGSVVFVFGTGRVCNRNKCSCNRTCSFSFLNLLLHLLGVWLFGVGN